MKKTSSIVPYSPSNSANPLALASAIAALLALPMVAWSEPTLNNDSYATTASGVTHGTATSLLLNTTNTVFLKFGLGKSLPTGVVADDIDRATLKIFVSSLTSPGAVTLREVTSSWDETTLSGMVLPTVGAVVGSGTGVNSSSLGRWVQIDVTTVFKNWVAALPASNNGLALSVESPSLLNTAIDSKENTGTSHPPTLEVVLVPTAGAADNPLRIALKRWYKASENGASFPVGSSPTGVEFDGSAVWVVNNGSNTVSRLSAATGATLGTFTVGSSPNGIAFDGTAIWVANYGSNNVSKLSAATGAPLGTFTVGFGPIAIAFDGSSIWVANINGDNVSKLSATTGATLGTFAVGSSPSGVAFDGTAVWVTNSGTNNVSKLSTTTGASLGTFAAGVVPTGIAFDGEAIWVANSGNSNVSKLSAATGAALGTFTVGTTPRGIIFDGDAIWVANDGSDDVSKLSAATGASLGTFTVGFGPKGVAFDGASVWVTNSGSNSVSKR